MLGEITFSRTHAIDQRSRVSRAMEEHQASLLERPFLMYFNEIVSKVFILDCVLYLKQKFFVL